MAAAPREIVEPYAQAIKIYNDFKKRIDANTVKLGDTYPYYPEYYYAFESTNILGMLKELCAQRELGCNLTNISGSYYLLIDTDVATPYNGDYQRYLLSYQDIVNLYYECIKIFSNKILPPKQNSKYAFKDKYYFGFLDLYSACNEMITEFAAHYLDSGLACNDTGPFYIIG